MRGGPDRPLRILHVLRSPVGGLFRHVVDLTRIQIARGHAVGVIADSSTGGARAEAILTALQGELALGLTRVPMSRHLGPADIMAFRHVARRAAESGADVVHGHGAKGGAYARLTRRRGAIRVYTPHGGSLHYGPRSPVGLLYLTLERVLMPRTELFLFESEFGRDTFAAKIGTPSVPIRVVHNGVTAAEFADITPNPDASDLVFVGELRTLKGVDVLIDAIGLLARDGHPVGATIVGDGPDAAAFRAQTERLGLSAAVRFLASMPAREAFARGRAIVVPSRAESLPYIVLEAAAAAIPMIATRVGGIPEILGAQADRLVAPGDAVALAQALRTMIADPVAARNAALTLRRRIQAEFSAETMAERIIDAYRATPLPG